MNPDYSLRDRTRIRGTLKQPADSTYHWPEIGELANRARMNPQILGDFGNRHNRVVRGIVVDFHSASL